MRQLPLSHLNPGSHLFLEQRSQHCTVSNNWVLPRPALVLLWAITIPSWVTQWKANQRSGLWETHSTPQKYGKQSKRWVMVENKLHCTNRKWIEQMQPRWKGSCVGKGAAHNRAVHCHLHKRLWNCKKFIYLLNGSWHHKPWSCFHHLFSKLKCFPYNRGQNTGFLLHGGCQYCTLPRTTAALLKRSSPANLRCFKRFYPTVWRKSLHASKRWTRVKMSSGMLPELPHLVFLFARHSALELFDVFHLIVSDGGSTSRVWGGQTKQSDPKDMTGVTACEVIRAHQQNKESGPQCYCVQCCPHCNWNRWN